MGPTSVVSSAVRLVAGGVLLLSLVPGAAFAGQGSSMSEYEKQKAEAERLFSTGAYQRSHDAWAAIDPAPLPKAEKKWVAFRLLDTEWRALAGSSSRDYSAINAAREKLEASIRDVKRDEDRDRVWAETQESIADWYWIRNDSRNWWQAWQHYQQALDWWAGANVDLDLARERYIAICRRVARPPAADSYYYYGYYGNTLPLPIVENVLTIAKSPDDKAWAHYLIAMTLKNQGYDYESAARVSEEFEASLALGKKTEWYDDALYNYAQYLESYGRPVQHDDGSFTQQQDYVRALELYRRFLREFKKGESRWYDSAKQQAEEIVRPTLSVGVSNVFLPGSLIPYYLNWRNVKSIDLALYPVDLARDVKLTGSESASSYLSTIDLDGKKPLRTWTKDTGDKGDYQPGSSQEQLGELPKGAYVLLARAGKTVTARDLVLVTDTTITAKAAPSKVVFWLTDSGSGTPIAGGKLTVQLREYRGSAYHWRTVTATTGEDGLAVLPRTKKKGEDGDEGDFYAAAISADRQSIVTGYAPSRGSDDGQWRIYAFTDRPAYRPGDKASWKFFARAYKNGGYTTPAGRTVEWEITDPMGAKVASSKATLNAFGAAWGELALTDKMPLGEYRITFYSAGRHDTLGDAVLLRLEEYKLPEFIVTVKTPEENGRRKTYRVGEKVTAEVHADYYFGGSVADADVEILVYQSPYYAWWEPPHEYPWLYEDMIRRPYDYGYGGSIIKQERVKTDAEGNARVEFDTPRGANQDFEYRIEARVTDSSRREVSGSGRVRVTRQRFYAWLTPRHYLYQPKDKVTVDVRTQDANGEPFPAEGKVAITRDHWWETYVSAAGNEISGEEFAKRAAADPQGTAKEGWRLKFRGYRHDDVETRTVKTGADGTAEIAFTPDRDGYYRLVWTAPEKGHNPVRAETTVWVATTASTDLGYRHGGIEVVVDKDTVHEGTKTPVMLVVPQSDRWVLFAVEADDLLYYRAVHVEGSTKLLQLDVNADWVPNVFLDAAMVQDQQLFTDQKQVVVPPERHFLTVTVEPDRPEYEARQHGTWTVTTKDEHGKPVSADVALSVADESVFAIQDEIAGDPRQFFFGEKRSDDVRTSTSFSLRSYAKILPAPVTPVEPGQGVQVEGALDESETESDLARDDNAGFGHRRSAGPGGGGKVAGNIASAAPAPPASKAVADEKSKKDGGRYKEEAQHAAPPNDRGPGGGGGEGEPSVQVRTDFRATAVWKPDLTTDADGHAKVSLSYPDSLTSWRATARAVSTGSQFGIATAQAKTRLPLLVRLQGPRFFVVGDETLVSGVVNNNTGAPITADVTLVAHGLSMKGTLVDGKASDGRVKVPANGEARVDFRIVVEKAGTATLKVVAKGAGKADAMEKSFPVFEHGVDKLIAKSGKLSGEAVRVKLALPKERRPGSTELTVQVAPSLAVTMLDALPYLIDYPYGCTEQTMSRFMPAVVVRKTLKDTGLPADQAMQRVFGGIEPAHADKTHPKGKKDLRDLDEMTDEGLKRLYDFQHADGGWGWWKQGDSDRFMTAYVLWGLALARDAGVEVKSDVMSRAGNWLAKELVSEEGSPDREAWMLHALAQWRGGKSNPGELEKKSIERLWKDHTRMNAYTRALFAIACQRYGETEKAKTLAANLENGVQKDTAPDTSIVMEGAQTHDASAMATAHWGEDSFWWRWSDSPIETTSFALMALVQIDPKSPLVEASMNWLVKNRRGAQWTNTKDTAIAVLALDQYLKVSGELGGNLEYELTVNGKKIAHRKITKADVLGAPSRFAVPAELVKESNDIRLTRVSGTGPLYFSAEARFFSMEEPVKPAGNEIFVRRAYFKKQGRRSLLKGWVYDTLPLEDGGAVNSGDRIEVVLTVETKNDYEYLLFEDLKPAGFEAVEVKSGEDTVARAVTKASWERNYGSLDPKEGVRGGKGLGASTDEIDYTGETLPLYRELRDRKVAIFADKLKQGVWEIRYELRAEVPGKFHALPVLGQAMYVPEIRANGSEIRVEVKERPEG